MKDLTPLTKNLTRYHKKAPPKVKSVSPFANNAPVNIKSPYLSTDISVTLHIKQLY